MHLSGGRQTACLFQVCQDRDLLLRTWGEVGIRAGVDTMRNVRESWWVLIGDDGFVGASDWIVMISFFANEIHFRLDMSHGTYRLKRLNVEQNFNH